MCRVLTRVFPGSMWYGSRFEATKHGVADHAQEDQAFFWKWEAAPEEPLESVPSGGTGFEPFGDFGVH